MEPSSLFTLSVPQANQPARVLWLYQSPTLLNRHPRYYGTKRELNPCDWSYAILEHWKFVTLLHTSSNSTGRPLLNHARDLRARLCL